MLVDEVTITVKAGDGGNGAATFRRSEGNPRGGPDGGNGGNGGNVYFQGVDDFTALQPFQYKKTVKADDGIPGKRKNLFGKNAEDLIVSVPIGTQITVLETGQNFEIRGTQGNS
jgi:GTPase